MLLAVRALLVAVGRAARGLVVVRPVTSLACVCVCGGFGKEFLIEGSKELRSLACVCVCVARRTAPHVMLELGDFIINSIVIVMSFRVAEWIVCFGRAVHLERLRLQSGYRTASEHWSQQGRSMNSQPSSRSHQPPTPRVGQSQRGDHHTPGRC